MPSTTPSSKVSSPNCAKATLSSYALYHLNATKPDRPQVDNSQTLNVKFATLEISGNSKNEVSLTEFAFFVKLPVEIQDEIWKIFVTQNPRRVGMPADYDKGYKGSWNPPVVIRQINRKLRAEALTFHGYVEYRESSATTSSSHEFLFNPSIDLVHISEYDDGDIQSWLEGFTGDSKAVSKKIRCVEFDLSNCARNGITASRFENYTRALNEWNSLELVFFLLQEKTLFGDWAVGTEGMFRFEAVSERFFLSSLPERKKRKWENFQQVLQKNWARETGKIVPQLRLVRKVIQLPRPNLSPD